jgi:hypothetical protein
MVQARIVLTGGRWLSVKKPEEEPRWRYNYEAGSRTG